MKTDAEHERKREEFNRLCEESFDKLKGDKNMEICLGCEKVESKNETGLNYVLCDDCRDNLGMESLDKETIKRKAALIVKNGMKWGDVLNFLDLIMVEQEDFIEILGGVGISVDDSIEYYESWEGSNDGA